MVIDNCRVGFDVLGHHVGIPVPVDGLDQKGVETMCVTQNCVGFLPLIFHQIPPLTVVSWYRRSLCRQILFRCLVKLYIDNCAYDIARLWSLDVHRESGKVVKLVKPCKSKAGVEPYEVLY